jgi:hypothetical protein
MQMWLIKNDPPECSLRVLADVLFKSGGLKFLLFPKAYGVLKEM